MAWRRGLRLEWEIAREVEVERGGDGWTRWWRQQLKEAARDRVGWRDVV